MKYCIGLLTLGHKLYLERKKKKKIIIIQLSERDNVFPFIESLSSRHIFLKKKI